MRYAKIIDLELEEAKQAADVSRYASARQARFKNSPFDAYRNSLMGKILNRRFAGKVLEVGSNTGTMTGSYATAASSIVLCDYELFYLKGARINHLGNEKKIKFACADAKSLPFKDASFDTVIVLEVIEHLPKDAHQELIAEAIRVGRPGATIYISTPNSFSVPGMEGKLMEFLVRGFRWNAWDDTHRYIYSAWGFVRFLNGFKVRIACVWGFYFLPGSLLVRMPLFIQKISGYFSYLVSRSLGRYFPLRYAGFTTIVELNKT